MSIYLYIRCEDCIEDSGVIGRNTRWEEAVKDEHGFLWRLYKEADEYLIKHKGHSVRLIDEFQQNPNEWPGWHEEE